MQIDRHQFLEELKLRKVIREGIQKVIAEDKATMAQEIKEEKKLRDFIRQMLLETATGDTDPAPSRTTGINVLEDLLKNIIPVLEKDYKMLTTSSDQRDSFRAHILAAVETTLKPVKITNQAGGDTELQEQEEIDIEVGDAAGPADPAFIDINAEEEAEEEEEEVEEPDEREEFGVEGQNVTGRNVAFDSFKQVENQIVDAYEILSDEEDQTLFYDYLLKNLDLYFDKFEADMQPMPNVPEIIPDEEAKMTDEEPVPGGEEVEAEEEFSLEDL